MSDQKDDTWLLFARYTALALLLPASSAAGYGIGYGLDRVFSTTYLRPVFLILGSAAGFYQLIRGLKTDK